MPDQNTTALRAALAALPKPLRTLHKAMIDIETVYFGSVGSPLEHLQLITSHPHFAWLQALSALMAQFDEWLDQVDEDATLLTAETAAGWRTAIEALVGPGAPASEEFRRRYLILLQDAPEVAMAHGALRAALAALPRALG